VDTRSGVSIYDEIDGRQGDSAGRAHMLLTCTAASVRLGGSSSGSGGGGGSSSGGGSDASISSRRRRRWTSAAASAAFDGDTLTNPTGTASAASDDDICAYAVAQRGSLDVEDQPCGGAVDITPLTFIDTSRGRRGRGKSKATLVATTLVSLDAVWFSDPGDDHIGDGDNTCYEIGARRALGGGAAMELDPSTAPKAATSASCTSWALVGARTRDITQAAIDHEACSALPQASSSPLVVAMAAYPPKTTNTATMTLLRWIFSVIFSSSSLARSAADASQSQGEFEDDKSASERAEAKEAAATAMLAEVLAVLNASPRNEGFNPIRHGTNLMDAGFDSLQIMELRRQLEGAGPAGCILTATAVMEHSTPAALTNHMMTWHVASAPGDGSAQGHESFSQSDCRLGRNAFLSARQGPGDNGSGRDPARATHVLLQSTRAGCRWFVTMSLALSVLFNVVLFVMWIMHVDG
jgi:aryl carrier-like protein